MAKDHENYEIRYMKPDGSVALIHVGVYASDERAHEAAQKLFDHSFQKNYEIWRDDECIKRGGRPLPETRGDKTSAKT